MDWRCKMSANQHTDRKAFQFRQKYTALASSTPGVSHLAIGETHKPMIDLTFIA